MAAWQILRPLASNHERTREQEQLEPASSFREYWRSQLLQHDGSIFLTGQTDWLDSWRPLAMTTLKGLFPSLRNSSHSVLGGFVDRDNVSSMIGRRLWKMPMDWLSMWRSPSMMILILVFAVWTGSVMRAIAR